MNLPKKKEERERERENATPKNKPQADCDLPVIDLDFVALDRAPPQPSPAQMIRTSNKPRDCCRLNGTGNSLSNAGWHL